MGHDHNHHHGDLKGKKLGFTIFLNIFITIAQTIGGLISGSLALLSDALHNFSDVIALIISYIANKLTKKKFTIKQTFGYKRAEIIAALINSTTLIAIAFMLVKEAITRFDDPAFIESQIVIILAVLSILVNGGSVLLLKKDSKDNLNMRSAYLHLFSDMISSFAVLIGGICMYYFQIFWIDSALSIMIAIYLVYSSFGLIKNTLKILMQFAPPDLNLLEVRDTILKTPLVKNVHHMHVWQLNDKEIQFEAHIDFMEDLKLSKVSEIIKKINHILHDNFHIEHSLLQPEFGLKDSKDLIIDERYLNRP